MAYDYKTSFMDMLGAIYDPVIVFPGGWGESLPEWLRQEIELERMKQVMEGSKASRRPEEATDAEALAYMYTASFLYPMPSDLVEVYLWLGKRAMGEQYPEHPPIEPPEELDQNQKDFLDGLKRWIWQKRLGLRRRRVPKERAPEGAESP